MCVCLMHTFLVSLLFLCLAQGAELTLGLILDYSVLLLIVTTLTSDLL